MSDSFTISFQRTNFLSAVSLLPFRMMSSEKLDLVLSIVFWKKDKWLLGFVLFGREQEVGRLMSQPRLASWKNTSL